jgi:hypothetical protein
MKNAVELEAEYGRDGKCKKRRVVVGGVVIWAIVVLVLCLSGHGALAIPASLVRLVGWGGAEFGSWIKNAGTAKPVGGKRKGQGSVPARSNTPPAGGCTLKSGQPP